MHDFNTMTEIDAKPHMKFRASVLNNESLIYPECPQARAWLESMGKMHIKANELHWLGKMGIEFSFITGKVKHLQKIVGKDKLNNQGVLKCKFDMAEQ